MKNYWNNSAIQTDIVPWKICLIWNISSVAWKSPSAFTLASPTSVDKSANKFNWATLLFWSELRLAFRFMRFTVMKNSFPILCLSNRNDFKRSRASDDILLLLFRLAPDPEITSVNFIQKWVTIINQLNLNKKKTTYRTEIWSLRREGYINRSLT